MRCVPIVACLLITTAAQAAGQSHGLIRGTVRTRGGAAAGASVVIRGNLASVTTTDSTGHFVLNDVAAGTHLLVATLEGWNAGSASASVRGGDTVSVVITLGNTQQLPAISVSATRPSSYYADSSVGGTKFPVSQLDLPQDIVVVNQTVIDDRHITAPNKLTSNVSGVIAQAPLTGAGLNEANFTFRGVPTSTYNNTLHDGFRDLGAVTRIDMSDVDHVEFIKGPESVVYGAVGSLGGIANFVSKQPLTHRAGELMLSADDNGGVRSTFDLGGPLSPASGIGYRITAAAERLRSFRDMSEGSNAFAIAPVLGWKPSSRIMVNFTTAYTQSRYRGDPYLPLFDGSFALPVSRFYGEPGVPFSKAQALTLQGIITYRVSDAVQLRQGLGYSASRQQDFNYDLDGVDSAGTVLRVYGRSTDHTRDATSQTEVLATLTSDGVANRMVMGVELFAEHYNGIYSTGDSMAPIDLNHPVYGAVPSDTGSENRYWIQQKQLGVYAQDLVELSQWMKVMLGARFDINRSQFSYQDAGETAITPLLDGTVHHVTPRVGLVFQPGQQTSLYGSWANSFTPNMSCARCGDPSSFPPEVGRQFEAGVKQQLAQGRFGATLAVYQLTKENVMIGDPSDPTGNRVLIVGQMRSRGIELDASGSPAPGLDLVAAYAFTDVKVTKGNDQYFPVGMVPAGQPRNRVSLWSTYTVHHGTISGFALGAGVTAQEAVYATWGDPLRLPGYAILDALLGYHGRSFMVQVNLTNLTNTRSYQGVSTLRVSPGPPRSLVTSVAYRF